MLDDQMTSNGQATSNGDELVVEVIGTQLQHFRAIDPPCRGMQLPDGIVLRYSLAQTLYFYLRTGVDNGKIHTRVFASDSPYDRQKAMIGEVTTPMFEAHADQKHLAKLEHLLREWVEFVSDTPATDQEFQAFTIHNSPRT